jgi:hypothetical protein
MPWQLVVPLLRLGNKEREEVQNFKIAVLGVNWWDLNFINHGIMVHHTHMIE